MNPNGLNLYGVHAKHAQGIAFRPSKNSKRGWEYSFKYVEMKLRKAT